MTASVFYMVALKDKSASFRLLNRMVNPLFDFLLERIVSSQDRQRAKLYACEACRGGVGENEADDWMRGMKTGF